MNIMHGRWFEKVFGNARHALPAALIAPCLLAADTGGSNDKPNFILIMADDQGYNDLGCYGSETIRTPHIDRMAQEGRIFTSFYMVSSVCTPSRAGLLTGSYPARISLAGGVVFPDNRHGLHPDEVTIADALKAADYATACIGKWHLGHIPELLPTAQGFDEYFGIPYSNDMTVPSSGPRPFGKWDESWADPEMKEIVWHTPLMRNEEIVELPVDQRLITRRFTDEAIRFVQENKDNPFFLYLPHAMPHVPLFVPDEWYDQDPKLAYIRTIEHMDAETGRLLDVVRELGLSDNTYVIYTSDNGPWLDMLHHGGSAKPLREGKMTTYDGGHRVPFVLWGPGIPAGTTSDALITALDLLPTFAAMAGVEFTPRGAIDGLDVSGALLGDEQSPREEKLYYSMHGQIEGIRQGSWKLRVAGGHGSAPELYHLDEDIGEQHNLAPANPERVQELTARMNALHEEIMQNQRSRWN